MSSADRRNANRAGFGSAQYGRRHFLKLAGGTAATIIGGTYLLGDGVNLARAGTVDRTFAAGKKKYFQLVAGDGFVSMPGSAAPIDAIWPDNLAPTDRDLYIFGFMNPDVAGAFYPGTGNPNFAPAGRFWLEKDELSAKSLLPIGHSGSLPGVIDARGQAEFSAPMIYFDEGDDVEITLWNMGLTMRPDLLDAHTIHWHGFPNQIPYFDGVPDSSLSVPVGKNLVYRYIIRQPGTFMYHCHVEDVEHVHMGLTGIVFIRPAINKGPAAGYANPSAFNSDGTYNGNPKYVFNDPATAYNREFAFILVEADVRDHWNDAHKQENDFTDYDPYFGVMNGRSYPDTLAPTRPDYMPGSMMLSAWESAHPKLHRNPWSSVIECNAGETVLLRFSDLGFKEHSMALPGLSMWVVGRDSEQLTAGRPAYAGSPSPTPRNVDATWTSDVIHLGPGESRDVLVKVPLSAAGKTFHFYDRMDRFADGPAGQTPGSMRTEFRVFAPGTLPIQSRPHQSFSPGGSY